MTVRIATPTDIPEIVRLTNLAFRVEDFFIDGDRTDLADVSERMAREAGCFLVIDGPKQGALVASAYVELRGPRGYFAMLAIDPARQGSGLGREVVHAIEERCRAAGCQGVDLSVVNLRTELPPFYTRLGYTVTGTEPLTTHTLKREAHFVLMSKELTT